MMQVYGALAGALIVFAIGMPLLLLRRKTLVKIIESGDSSRIPAVKRAKYEKKGIPADGIMAEFEKENMNFAMKHPVLWVVFCSFLAFVVLFIQGGI